MGKIINDNNIGIYVRKSVTLEKGDTLELQIEECKIAAERDLNVSRESINYYVYKDEKSGKNTEREGFQGLLKEARKRRIKTVYVYKVDRFCRDAADLLTTIKELDKLNVVLISVKDGIRTDSVAAKILIPILGIIAEIERKNTVERVIDANKRLSQKGFWLGGIPPFGFNSEYVDNNGVADADAKKLAVLCPNEKEQEVVKLLFNMCASGEMKSYAEITRMLEDMGILTKTGKSIFSTKTVEGIYRNPVYAQADQSIIEYYKEMGYEESQFLGLEKMNGEYSIRKINTCTCSETKKKNILNDKPEDKVEGWESIENEELTVDDLPTSLKLSKSEQRFVVGPQKGFIDAKTWLTVQRRLDRRKGEKSKICVSHDNVLLKGKMFRCKKCGNTIGYYNHHSKKDYSVLQPQYRCNGKKGHKSDCTVSNINAEELDEKIIDIVFGLKEEYITNHEYLSAIFEEVEKNSRKRDIGIMKNNIQKKIKEKERIVNTLISLDGAVNKEVIDNINIRYERLNTEIEEIENRIKEMEKEERELKRNIDDFSVLADEIIGMDRKTFNNLSMGQKRAIIMEIIEYVEWDGEKVDIHFRQKDGLNPSGVSKKDTPVNFLQQNSDGLTSMVSRRPHS